MGTCSPEGKAKGKLDDWFPREYVSVVPEKGRKQTAFRYMKAVDEG